MHKCIFLLSRPPRTPAPACALHAHASACMHMHACAMRRACTRLSLCTRAQSDSHENALARGRMSISVLVEQLRITHPNEATEAAHRLYRLAMQRGFTRGRRVDQVGAKGRGCTHLDLGSMVIMQATTRQQERARMCVRACACVFH